MYTTELKNRKKNLECQYKNSLKKEEKGFKRYDKTSYNEKKIVNIEHHKNRKKKDKNPQF